MQPTEIDKLYHELVFLLQNTYDSWEHRNNIHLKRIIEILNVPEIISYRENLHNYAEYFPLLIIALMTENRVDVLELMIESQLLRKESLNNSLLYMNYFIIWKAASHTNPEFFKLLYEHSNHFSDLRNHQKLINHAFINAYQSARFETMQFLIDNGVGHNCTSLFQQSSLCYCLIDRMNAKLVQVLDFLYQNGIDLTKPDDNAPGQYRGKTLFEMLLEVGHPEGIEFMLNHELVDIYSMVPSIHEIVEEKLQLAIEQKNMPKEMAYRNILTLFSSYKMPPPHMGL